MTRNWPLFALADCLANQTGTQAIHQTKNASDHSPLGSTVPYSRGSPAASKAQQSVQNKDRAPDLPGLPAFYRMKKDWGGSRGWHGSTLFLFLPDPQIYSGCIFSRSDHGCTRRTYTNLIFHICIFKILIASLETNPQTWQHQAYTHDKRRSFPLRQRTVLSALCHTPTGVAQRMLPSPALLCYHSNL